MLPFSERIGVTTSVRAIQLSHMDEPLLNGLWNVYNSHVMQSVEPSFHDSSRQDRFTELVWGELFKQTYDTAPAHYDSLKQHIRNYFFSSYWYEVYNLIEFALKIPFFSHLNYIESINTILEKEYSGYRFVNDILIPISNVIETENIDEAIKITAYTFDGNANIHLSNSLKSISQKPNADYRNSVKEAISAVGTIVRKITGKNSFGEGLKYLEQNGLKINNQFKEGLNKFYNYSNDSSTGIRHEIVDSPNPPDFETAKFMLLTCSAFINYIIPIAQKAGIDIKDKK